MLYKQYVHYHMIVRSVAYKLLSAESDGKFEALENSEADTEKLCLLWQQAKVPHICSWENFSGERPGYCDKFP